MKAASLKYATFILITLLIFFHGNALSSNLEEDSKGTIAALQAKIPEIMQQVDVPGLSIAIIQNSKVVWSQGFGITDYDLKTAVTENTIFEAGSLSKPVFAYAVLKLVDAGLIDLDQSLSGRTPINYIQDQKLDQVTARTILSHTSGFPLWWPENESLKIHFSPGERFSYSSEGYVYLQNVIEAIAEKSLSELMKSEVFEPLKMNHSSFVWNDRFDKHLAFGHNQLGQEETPWKRSMGNAASSLLTTVGDYARFVLALLKENGLRPETLNEMFTSQVQLNPNCIECLDNQSNTLSELLSWGLGWGLLRSGKETLFWHWADNLRFTSFCIASPKSKSGVIFFTNGSNGLTLADEIVSKVFGNVKPIFDWLKYERYDSPAVLFRQTVLKKGAEEGLTTYFELKRANRSNGGFISENSMNELGYILLNIDRVPEAIDIFRLNVEEHPDSWNAYDSLAEAYAAQGDKERAINYYNIALRRVKEEDQKKRIEKTLQRLDK
jgi:CubicO group peptidase (beta-lactamase class C family)